MRLINRRWAALCKTAFFLLLLIPFSDALGQKSTRVRGKVIDAKTGEPLPFVNVSFVGKNVGTTTGFDGKYMLDTKWGSDSVQASFIGYKAQTRFVVEGDAQVIDFELEPASIELKEVTVKADGKRYRNRDNPAVALINRVVEHRDQNRKEGFDSYQFDKYEKLELDLNNITEKFRESKSLKKFSFMWDYIDTSEVNGKPYLPLYLTETKSKVYLRKSPELKREVRYGVKTVGFKDFMDEEGITYFMEKIYQDVNIYDNSINLMDKQFKSPISNIAPNIYKYFIKDTVLIDGAKFVIMAFMPRNDADLAFRGDMWVALDSSYAVKKVKMNITRSANINFVSDLLIEQEFEHSDSLGWYLVKDIITIDYNLLNSTMGMYGKKTTSYRDIQVNKATPDSVSQMRGTMVTTGDAETKTSEFWNNNRHDSLTTTEKGVYAMTRQLKELPAFKRAMNILFTLLSGYYDLGKVDVGALYSLISFNQVETWRFRAGLRTNDKLSRKFMAEGYIAYGLDKRVDRRLKGGLGFTWFFKRRPYHQIDVEWQRDIKMPGQDLLIASDDNIFLSFRTGIANLMLYYDSYRISWSKEWYFGLTVGLSAEHRDNLPAGALRFDPVTGINPRKSVSTNEVGIWLRYAPNVRFYEGRLARVPMRDKNPITSLSYTYNIPNILNSRYEYHRLGLRVEKRFFINPIGYGDTRFEAGYTFGNVAFPIMYIHRGNQTFFHDPNTFNLMNWFEFVSDKYVMLDYYHHFNWFIFDYIPGLKKLKWRLTAGVKAVYGGVSAHNDPNKTRSDDNLFEFPTRQARDFNGEPIYNIDGSQRIEQVTHTLEKMPYVEASMGLENIIKVASIDVIRRFTYLDHPNLGPLKGWGVKVRFAVRF